MKKILWYFKNHLQKDFHLVYYGIVLLFLVISFAINYSLNFEAFYLNARFYDPYLILYFLPYYMLPYYFTTVAYAIVKKKYSLLRNRYFWGRSIFILTVLSINSGAAFFRIIAADLSPRELVYFIDSIVTNVGSSILFLVPIYIFKLLFDRHKRRLYGITKRNFTAKPYLLLLLLMTPVIWWASYQPDFLSTYPTFRILGHAEEYLGVSGWVTQSIYEFVYILDFAFVELLFRGFMVIGMAGIMGRAAIMPMVTTYAFLHFGKPIWEAIGSIFGGYILGVIAYYSRNIWGGIIIHCGVALMMELTAIVQWNRQ